jgi:hypothetical protein
MKPSGSEVLANLAWFLSLVHAEGKAYSLEVFFLVPKLCGLSRIGDLFHFVFSRFGCLSIHFAG